MDLEEIRKQYYKDFNVGSYRPALEDDINWWLNKIRQVIEEIQKGRDDDSCECDNCH